MPLGLIFPVEKLDADTIRRLNECDARSRIEIGRLETECNAFVAQAIAKTIEVASHAQAEVIDAPFEARLLSGALGRTLAANDDYEAAERDVDLGGTLDFEAPHDLDAELLDIPVGSGLRI